MNFVSVNRSLVSVNRSTVISSVMLACQTMLTPGINLETVLGGFIGTGVDNFFDVSVVHVILVKVLLAVLVMFRTGLIFSATNAW